MRAGAQTVTLLGAPRSYLILRSLEEGPKGRLELRRDAGSPAQSTLRNHLNLLETAGAVAKSKQDAFPGALEYGLTDCGRELLSVARSLERWLAGAPGDPLELGSDRAKVAIKGLADSWCATVLTCLAAEPLSLTELDKRISAVSYPTIERCLETMRLAEQLDVGARNHRGTPYAVRGWVRRGVAPLTSAARWEHRNRRNGAAPVRRTDVDGALRLIGPMLDIPKQASGVCQLAVRVPDGERHDRRLGFLEVRDGRIRLGPIDPPRAPDASASGPMDSWFSTLIDANRKGLRLSGDRSLPEAVFDSVHRTLFESRAAPPQDG